MKKVILDLCGGTGAWSRPYKEAGYEVINVTLSDYDVTKTDFNSKFIEFGSPSGETLDRIEYKDILKVYGDK